MADEAQADTAMGRIEWDRRLRSAHFFIIGGGRRRAGSYDLSASSIPGKRYRADIPMPPGMFSAGRDGIVLYAPTRAGIEAKIVAWVTKYGRGYDASWPGEDVAKLAYGLRKIGDGTVRRPAEVYALMLERATFDAPAGPGPDVEGSRIPIWQR